MGVEKLSATGSSQPRVVKKFTCIFKKLAGNYNQKHIRLLFSLVLSLCHKNCNCFLHLNPDSLFFLQQHPESSLVARYNVSFIMIFPRSADVGVVRAVCHCVKRLDEYPVLGVEVELESVSESFAVVKN